MPIRRLLFVLALLAIAAAAIGYYLYTKPVARMADLKADLQIEATALYAAYDENEETANARFLGKVLEVEGVLLDITPAGEGDVRLTLEGGGLAGGVSCRLSPEAAQEAAQLTIGQKVRLRGQCDGFLMDVELSRCILLSSPK